MAYFTLAVGTSGPVQQVTDFDAWTLDNNLDDGCSIAFTLRGNSVAALIIDELVTDVFLYRGPTLFQRFRIVAVSQDWGPDGQDSVSIAAVCYRRMLKSRHARTDLTYTATSQGTIVWNLIQHAQAATNGNLGITLGTSGPAILRDRAYVAGQNLFDAITEMTQIDNGLTWDINAQLQLNISQPSAYPTIAMPCELGVVARAMSRPSSAEKFGNATITTGDSLVTVPYIAEAPGLALDPRGRWEKFTSVGSVKEQAQLVELGDGLVEEAISPVSVWRIEMEPTRYFFDAEYELGDIITVVQPRSTVYPIGVAAPTIQTQVISRSVSETADGATSVVITAVELP